jgi:Legionella pneumophila major outer membrane protein precursor
MTALGADRSMREGLRMRFGHLGTSLGVMTLAVGINSTGALAQAYPNRPAVFATLEGGAACTTGEKFETFSGARLGSGECGFAGALRLDQTGVPLWLGFDSWGAGVRYMGVDQTKTGGLDQLDERRFVIDVDASRPLGFGLFGGTSALVVGIRYADYQGDIRDAGVAGSFEFRGIGPRIGLAGSIPLGTNFRFDTRSSISALFGHHDNAVTGVGSQDHSGTVFVYESNMALTYAFAPQGNGPEFSIGVRSEYWFNQVRTKDDALFNKTSIDRNAIGPFARVKIPLGN